MEDFGFAIVVTGSREPFVLNGAFSQGILFIESKDPLPTSGKTDVINALVELKLDRKLKRGLKVIVSEASPDISKAIGAHHRTINDRSGSGVPIINIAIPAYEELFNSASVVVSEESGMSIGAFTLNQSTYEIKYTTMGDAFYHINWDLVSDNIKAALLAVYSTTYHAVDSASYLKSVGLILNAEPPAPSDVQAILSTVADFDQKRINEIKEAGGGTLTGQIYKNNKNDRVL